MKAWVLIPAYNEERTLGEVLSQLKRKDISILVIDDGSTDKTSYIAKQAKVNLIKNKKNSGKGISIKRGIKYLLENEQFDYVITMDADGQHSPSDLDKFLEEAERGEYFVVGNRMDNPQGMSFVRILTNKFMSWLISKIVKQKIPDTQCGFRLIKKDVLQEMRIETDKYQIESEFLIKAAHNGIPIKSIPIRSIYFRGLGSKINPIIDTIRFIKFLFAYAHSLHNIQKPKDPISGSRKNKTSKI
jgi:glycosyltransferase involved in cell wall biosynthesis